MLDHTKKRTNTHLSFEQIEKIRGFLRKMCEKKPNGHWDYVGKWDDWSAAAECGTTRYHMAKQRVALFGLMIEPKKPKLVEPQPQAPQPVLDLQGLSAVKGRLNQLEAELEKKHRNGYTCSRRVADDFDRVHTEIVKANAYLRDIKEGQARHTAVMEAFIGLFTKTDPK